MCVEKRYELGRAYRFHLYGFIHELVGLSNPKKDDRWPIGSRINPYYSEVGRAGHMGKGLTGIRSLQRKLVPDI